MIGAFKGGADYILAMTAGGPNGALQTEFPASVTQTFTGGDQPKAGMVYEGDFVQVNIGETKAEVGTDAKVLLGQTVIAGETILAELGRQQLIEGVNQ